MAPDMCAVRGQQHILLCAGTLRKRAMHAAPNLYAHCAPLRSAHNVVLLRKLQPKCVVSVFAGVMWSSLGDACFSVSLVVLLRKLQS